MKITGVKHFLIAIAFLSLAGCKTVQMERSGFLKDYSGFTESKEFPGMMVYKADPEKVKKYTKFMVDPVTLYFSDPANAEDIKPESMADITTYFHDQIVKALKDGGYEVVDQPGVGVMRIRAAVTDLVANKVYLNLHWATKLTKAGVGGACMEAEFIDSLTGERLGAAVDARQGRGWKFLSGLSAWGSSKDACVQWAKMLKKRLDAIHKE